MITVFDVGGTNTKYAIFDARGGIVEKKSVKTPSRYDELLELIATIGEKTEKIVIGVPGIIDYISESIVYSPNLTYLQGKTIKKDIGNKNILIENDANLAAVGEYCFGWDNSKSFLMVTLGTGVGGGVILDGKLLRTCLSVGEIGHILVERGGFSCNCGRKGCLEAYCGKNGLLRMFEDLSGKCIESVSILYNMAKRGDLIANLVFKQYANYLAEGIASILNVVCLENVVLGGGLIHYSDIFFKDFIKFFSGKIYPAYKNRVIISIAKLKNDAALYGGYHYAKSFFGAS